MGTRTWLAGAEPRRFQGSGRRPPSGPDGTERGRRDFRSPPALPACVPAPRPQCLQGSREDAQALSALAAMPLGPLQPQLHGVESLKGPFPSAETPVPPSTQDARGVMDGIVRFQPSPPPDGALLTTAFSTPSLFVIEDINLFLHPVSSMLRRSQPSPDEVCVCRPLIIPIPFGALPDAGTARRTCRRLSAVSSLSIHSPAKQGHVLKE